MREWGAEGQGSAKLAGGVGLVSIEVQSAPRASS